MADAHIPTKVFTRDREQGGVFSAPGLRSSQASRIGFLRTQADDITYHFETARDIRVRHADQVVAGDARADIQEVERQALVQDAERKVVRDSALLFSQIVRFTDPSVLAEQMKTVLTEGEISDIKLALMTLDDPSLNDPSRIRELQRVDI